MSALCLASSVISSFSTALWSHSRSHRVLRCPLIAGWEAAGHDSVSFCLLLLTVAAVAPAAGAGVSTSCVPPPPLPVPLSLQYGSPVWEAAIPLFLHPFHLAVLLWVLAPLCPTHPVEGTGSKSLWYLAPRCPEQVTRRAFCLFSPWTELTTVCCRPPPSCFCLCCRSACLCCTQTKLSNPISSVCQRLSPATVVFGPCKPCLCFIATLPWIQLLDAFYRCTNLELLGVH